MNGLPGLALDELVDFEGVPNGVEDNSDAAVCRGTPGDALG